MSDNPIKEVTFKFSDGEYICREDMQGDSILGPSAHKIMYALWAYERGHNSASVYRFTFHDKVKFILERAEYLINYA